MEKIAFLLTQSLESPSGLGRYGPLARQLANTGYKVEIFTLHPAFDELNNKNFELDGVKVHYVSQMHVMKNGDTKRYYSSLELLLTSMKATWHLCRSAINTKADIVHIGKPHPMNSIAGICARIINKSDLYLDCDDYEAGSGRFSSWWQKSVVTFFEKWMPHRVKAISTNTFFMQEKLLSWGIHSEKILYLPNGVDQQRFSHVAKEEIDSLRNSLDLASEQVIGYVGSLSLPSHPVDLLLEAYKVIRKHLENSVLLIVGGGEDLHKLKSLAQDLEISNGTRFIGRISPEKIPLYYALFDVSADPVYDNEAAKGRSPLKMFESWACEIPFVTADVGDRKILIGDPPAGLLSHPGNPESLAESIQQVLSDDKLSTAMVNAGAQRVKEFYWDNLTADLIALYTK